MALSCINSPQARRHQVEKKNRPAHSGQGKILEGWEKDQNSARHRAASPIHAGGRERY